jgi:O-antigen/teichoic acid export membrane protein
MAGLNNGLSYWSGQPVRGGDAIRMSSLLNLLSAASLALIALLLREPLGTFLGWPQAYVLIFCVGLLTTTTSSFYEEASIATGHIWRGAIFGAGLDLLRTLSVLAAGILTHSLATIFVAYVGIHAFKALAGFALGAYQGLVRLSWNAEIFGPVWRYAWPVSVSAIFWMIINYSDQVILTKILSPADFAFYSIGCLTVPPLLILEISINRVLIPELARAFNEGRPREAARLYSGAVRELSYFALPAITGMIVFAAPIIELLFTRGYSSASSYLRAYALYYLAIIIPIDAVPRARGEAQWILWSYAAFSLLTLGLCLGLTLAFGPFGALAGLLGARLLNRAYAAIYVARTTHWRASEFLPIKDLSRCLVVCGVLGAGCLAVRPLFGSERIWFFSAGAGFSLAYFGLTLLTGSRLPIRFESLRRLRS